jgi:hypothetical protein
MIKAILYVMLFTMSAVTAQLAAGPQRLRSMLKTKSTSTRADNVLDNHDGRLLLDELSMSMSLVVFEGIEDIDDEVDEVDTPTELLVDWICQFCPAYLCVNCAEPI